MFHVAKHCEDIRCKENIAERTSVDDAEKGNYRDKKKPHPMQSQNIHCQQSLQCTMLSEERHNAHTLEGLVLFLDISKNF